MRSVLWATVFIAGFATLANAQAPLQQINSVGSVDRTGKTFSTWRGATTTFKTNDRTAFRVGSTPTSMAALKAGNDVTVRYHIDGKDPIADEVVINN